MHKKRRGLLASFFCMECQSLSDRVIVVGGGPAGMMAAGRAAECGADVLLIEKTPRLGNKLRLIGGGRGNVTHAGDAQSIAAHLGPNGDWCLAALQRFGPRELIAFLRERDVPIVIEPDGRVFPATRNAHTVLAALGAWCLAHSVTFRYRSPVNAIEVVQGCVTGVAVDDRTIGAAAVVLATGGVSYPATGSTGDGFRLAESLGHRVIPPAPGLVPLVATDAWIPDLAGVGLADVALVAAQRRQILAVMRGDLLFTVYGLSGPAALDLSSSISRDFQRGAIQLKIDLLPDVTSQSLDEDLRLAFQVAGRSHLGSLLQGRAPAAVIRVVQRLACVGPSKPVAELSAADRLRVVDVLKGLPVTLVATRPIQEAMVTLGGVATAEIDPHTMGSRLARGLFFAGELIDIAGSTGGYNLQAAFATGRLAGEVAAGATGVHP